MSEDFKPRLDRAKKFAASLDRIEQETARSLASKATTHAIGARPDFGPKLATSFDWAWGLKRDAHRALADWDFKWEFAWVRELERLMEHKASRVPEPTWADGRE